MAIKDLETEQRNPASMHLDTMTTLEMVETINREDQKISQAVHQAAPVIAKTIDRAASRYARGGRLIYIGAGTSGRLGVLDAVELVPTYGIKKERAIGLIAGGEQAMYQAVEGAEDDLTLASQDLKAIDLSSNDVVFGLAASGRTPYVIGGLDYARRKGALAVAIACVPHSVIGTHADLAIEAVTGPEVVTGSTRMKAGTAEKMILNMISTGVMVRQGKVYQNVMIDVQPTNQKLIDRAIRIIMTTTGVDEKEAGSVLQKADRNVALAIVMAKTGSSVQAARQLLERHHGRVGEVLKS